MATERIDILVNSRGERVVNRKLGAIGDTARRTSQDIRNLQNALFVLGGAGILRAIGRAADTLTNFENRLKLVTSSEVELEAVSDRLFDVAARTRTEFGLTGEIFTRLALNTRGLGYSQAELIGVTETLNKATILSGASAREANAALIQLSQGLASNRLSGDELRSVLEQLPLVADIIAKQLGITRGELRKFGREGKISAGTVIEAFKAAKDEIDEAFAKTVPTLSQAFTVLGVKALELLDAFDDTTGVSGKLANAIISIAESLSLLSFAAIAAGTAFAGLQLFKLIARYKAFAAANSALAIAVRTGNATLLTSQGIAKAKAATDLAAARATDLRASAELRAAIIDQQQLKLTRARLIQQQASIAIDSRRRIARDALTGRFIAYNAAVAQNVRTNIALSRTEDLLTASRARLRTATAAQIVTQNGLTASTARATKANIAATGFIANLQGRFPLLANAIGSASSAFTRFGGVLAKNPFGAVLTIIIAIAAAIFSVGDAISVTSDGVVTLKDVFIASLQIIGEAISPLTDFIVDSFSMAYDITISVWSGLVNAFSAIAKLTLIATTLPIRLIVAIFEGAFAASIAAWAGAPAAFEKIGISIANALISAIEFAINEIIKAIAKIANPVGGVLESLGFEDPLQKLIGKGVTLKRFTGSAADAGVTVGGEFVRGFSESLANTDPDKILEGFTGALNKTGDVILERARKIAEERRANLNKKGDDDDLTGGKKGNRKKTFEDIVRQLQVENELLKVNSRERAILSKILDVEKELKRELNAEEKQLIADLVLQNEQLQKQAEILENLNGPAEDYKVGLAAANQLLKEGKINQEQFNLILSQMKLPMALRELDKELLNTRFAHEATIADIRTREAEQLEVVRQALEERIIIEEQAAERIAAIRANTDQKILEASLKTLKLQLDSTQGAFDTLTQFAKDYAGEQSGIYKGIFVAKQAFALASAIVNTALAVSEALASGPPPYNFIQAAAVGIAGAAQVATIIGQTISAFAEGGEVRGKGGSRQDRVQAALSPGEFVVNAKEAQRNLGLLRAINDGQLSAATSTNQIRTMIALAGAQGTGEGLGSGNGSGQRGAAGGSSASPARSLTVIQNIQAQDPESFGASQRQMARRSKRAFEDVQ